MQSGGGTGNEVTIPGDKNVPIRGRKLFPDLDMEYIPGVFAKEHLATFMGRLGQLTYTNAIYAKGRPSSSAYYAWFADRGDWLCNMGTSVHDNSFIPGAWPMVVSDMRAAVLLRLPHYNHDIHANVEWNACLLTCLPPGASHAWGPVERGAWARKGDMAHEDHVVIANTSVTLQVTSRSPSARSLRIEVLPGAVIIVGGSGCMSEWTFTYTNAEAEGKERGIVYVGILRSMAAAQFMTNQTGTPRTIKAIDQEKRIIPLLMYKEIATVASSEQERAAAREAMMATWNTQADPTKSTVKPTAKSAAKKQKKK